jgi:uncharacterized protein DUF4145
MIIKIPGISALDAGSTIASLRCPACRQRGTFERVLPNDLGGPGGEILGQRRCPNPECRAHVFVVIQRGVVVETFPAERIDFDPVNVPAQVLTALEEAITCHANSCYVASAIMVRKTLEELCSERGATGPNLKERIKALQAKVILPSELLQGLDDLRLLGNDAAHVESQEYNQVGIEEVEVGIEFAKEVLKAVYQYSALLQRLRALKKAP